jgi:hypothetical protein
MACDHVAPVGVQRYARPMNAGLGRNGRFALGSVVLAGVLWAAVPWVFCSETWAREAPVECTAGLPTADASPRSLRDSAPPLAPLFL